MRARNIKPGFFKNEILCSMEPLARILFAGLWCIADRDGKLEDRPLRIKAELLPYDNCDAEALLSLLNDRGFIKRYEHEGCKYIIILHFKEHQTPHWQEKESSIPNPDSPKKKPRVIQDKSKCNPSDLKKGIRNQESENQESGIRESENQPETQFQVFWREYPRKKKIGDAEKAWKKISPSNGLFEKIMAKVAEGKESEDWTKENGKYIPYPASWLNSKGWEDEFKHATLFKPQPGIAAWLERTEGKENES